MISFFLQTWKVSHPMGRGQQGESIKTTFIFWSFILSPWWAFFWSSENLAKRHFWQIDIFFVKDVLVRRMIWLDAPHNTLEIQTLRIFLSSSYELWQSFFYSSAYMVERYFWKIDIFFLKSLLVKIMIWLDAPYNTLEIHTIKIFYHRPMSCGRHFPNSS